jgi:DNA polymerase epsilon subunit 1
LQECCESVTEIANYWIDVLDTQGESLETDELVDLISENHSMSRQLDDYGDQKGTSQTTARRLGEFLGADIMKDKGLNCKFIIAEQPYGAPVTERAIPTAIRKAEPAVIKHYLRKCSRLQVLTETSWIFEMCSIGSILLGLADSKDYHHSCCFEKHLEPSASCSSSGLVEFHRQLHDRFQLRNIRSMFQTKGATGKKPQLAIQVSPTVVDMEDFGGASRGSKRPIVHQARRSGRRGPDEVEDAKEPADESEARLPLSKEGSATGWYRRKKVSWRKFRRERKRRGTGDQGFGRGSSSTQLAKKPLAAFSSMEGYSRDAAMMLTQSEWHVVEVREMSSYDSNGQARGNVKWRFCLVGHV